MFHMSHEASFQPFGSAIKPLEAIGRNGWLNELINRSQRCLRNSPWLHHYFQTSIIKEVSCFYFQWLGILIRLIFGPLSTLHATFWCIINSGSLTTSTEILILCNIFKIYLATKVSFRMLYTFTTCFSLLPLTTWTTSKFSKEFVLFWWVAIQSTLL